MRNEASASKVIIGTAGTDTTSQVVDVSSKVGARNMVQEPFVIQQQNTLKQKREILTKRALFFAPQKTGSRFLIVLRFSGIMLVLLSTIFGFVQQAKAQSTFYVKDNSKNLVAAKFLTDANGVPIQDPNYSTAALQDIYDQNGTLLNGGFLGSSYNPNGYLIVPLTYDVSSATSFATLVKNTMIEAPDTGFGAGGEQMTGLPAALSIMSGAFLPGGSQDLQRTYNGTQYGPTGTYFVNAFTDATSFHLGLVSAYAGLPIAWPEFGGGALNVILNHLSRTVPLDTDGPFHTTYANGNSIVAGYNYGSTLPGGASAPSAPSDIALQGETGDIFSTGDIAQSSNGQIQINLNFNAGGSESSLLTNNSDGSARIVTTGYPGANQSGGQTYQNATAISSSGAVGVTDTKLYQNGVLTQDDSSNPNGYYNFAFYDATGTNPLFQFTLNNQAQATQASFSASITSPQFMSAAASALATQVIAQFLFKNNLPVSVVAQAVSNTSIQAILGITNQATQTAFASLTVPQQFAASYGIALAGIAAGIGGSVAGTDLFKALGLPPEVGSVAGSALSQQVIDQIINSASGNTTLGITPGATSALQW